MKYSTFALTVLSTVLAPLGVTGISRLGGVNTAGYDFSVVSSTPLFINDTLLTMSCLTVYIWRLLWHTSVLIPYGNSGAEHF